jgi:hypothetical protein
MMKTKHTTIILITLLGLLLISTTALAASDYQINWWTVDGGGGTSQSADGHYTLNGTIGQPDVGAASGDDFAIKGGFWGSLSAAIQEFFVHLPLITSSE